MKKTPEINQIMEDCGFEGQSESEYEYDEHETANLKSHVFPDDITGLRQLIQQTAETTDDQQRRPPSGKKIDSNDAEQTPDDWPTCRL